MNQRHIQRNVEQCLRVFPAAVITGARQVGKSTLAKMLISKGWNARYITLDDRMILDAVLSDPDGWLSAQGEDPLVIDEVQRAPDLLRAIKLEIDRKRRPGRFLLTGSTNLLLSPQIKESLAGRAAIFRLLPFSWREKERQGPPALLDLAFKSKNSSAFLKGLPPVKKSARGRDAIVAQILEGGYPPVAGMNPLQRGRWFSSYRQTYVERDLRDISAIQSLPDFNRLLTSIASRSAEIFKVSENARDLGMVEMTVKRYVDLLEVTYQVYRLYPYFINIGKRLVKRPKLYFLDSGICAHLAGFGSWRDIELVRKTGHMAETWVAGEILKWISCQEEEYGLFFWRAHGGEEVDFLVIKGGEVVPIEVKWSSTILPHDLKGLTVCKEVFGKRLRMSIILYLGDEVRSLTPNLVAIPLSFAFGP